MRSTFGISRNRELAASSIASAIALPMPLVPPVTIARSPLARTLKAWTMERVFL